MIAQDQGMPPGLFWASLQFDPKGASSARRYSNIDHLHGCTMPEGLNLILVHVSKSRPSNKLAQDDYDVWDGSARIVGRIVRTTAAPPGQSWFWTITERALQRPTDLGYAATREEALAAFKRAWQGK